jgi:hypothetical protein
MPLTFALIHSPLTGPLIWQPVAAQLRRLGHPALAPELDDSGDPASPYWLRHARSAAEALKSAPAPLALVAHSGAGPLLPAVRQALGHPVAAYLLADAGLPHPGQSRLESFFAEDKPFAAELQASLAAGGRFPDWTEASLAEVVPDPGLRRALVADLRPRGLDFFTEPLPSLPGWPDAPAGYLRFSIPYEDAAARARQQGWPVRHAPAGHFHPLVAPETVAQALLDLARSLLPAASAARS